MSTTDGPRVVTTTADDCPAPAPAAHLPGRASGRTAAVALPACILLGGWCASTITAAMPELASAMPDTAWVVPGYFIGAAMSAPMAGRIADRVGARRVALVGLVITVLASLVSATSTSGVVLTAARIVLGAGTAALFPSALVILRRLPVAERRKLGVLALLALATEAAFAAGPAVGALLVDHGGWRWAVLAPAPLAVLAAVLVVIAVPPDPVAPQPVRTVLRALDLPGLALLAVAAAALLVWLSSPRAGTWYLPAGAIGAAAAFTVWESRFARHPLLPPAIMTASVIALYGRTVLYYASLYSLVLSTPAWLVSTRGLPATTTAAIMGVLPVTTVIACLVTPRLVDRHGARYALLLGAAAMGSPLSCWGSPGRTPRWSRSSVRSPRSVFPQGWSTWDNRPRW